MSSAALLPTLAAGMLSATTPAAFLGWPSGGSAQLQIRMSVPARLKNLAVMSGAGAPIKKRPASSVLQRDDVQAEPSSEAVQEVKFLRIVEEMTAGFEEEVGAEMESTMQHVEKVVAGIETLEVVVNGAGGKTKMQQNKTRRKNERKVYLLAAIASTTGFTALSASSCVYRFWVQMPDSESISYGEIFATFSLAVGAAVGMEYWARWAHRALWHASLWHMHESHHGPRDGPFETNDVFAIFNAIPAFALMLYGFLNPGIVPAVCFGAGLGITMFGIAYMFVHDGLVHRRFPVGPIAEVPYLQKVAAAHQLHHADLYEGVPYGLFLGPKVSWVYGQLDYVFCFSSLLPSARSNRQELEDIGGGAELEKWLSRQRAKAAEPSASAGKDK